VLVPVLRKIRPLKGCDFAERRRFRRVTVPIASRSCNTCREQVRTLPSCWCQVEEWSTDDEQASATAMARWRTTAAALHLKSKGQMKKYGCYEGSARWP